MGRLHHHQHSRILLAELLQALINEIYQAGIVNHLQRFQQSAESKELDREGATENIANGNEMVTNNAKKVIADLALLK